MSTWFVLVALFLSLSCHGIEAGRKTSPELQSQSPSPSPSFKPENDKEYECVEIHKQPAFDHILLKNHTIQMAPSFLPKFKKNSELKSNNYHPFESDDDGCPPGMVPIQRAKSLNTADIHPLTVSRPGTHFATMRPKLYTKNFGASAYMGLDYPRVKMDQVSAGTIWVENGSGAEVNSIQAGWAVHSRLYGDTLTRLTGYWTIDGAHKTGCYNTRCPGFVQVNPRIFIGGKYKIPAKGERLRTHVAIRQDLKTKHWWLTLEHDSIQIGYWPNELFTHFDNEGALVMQFGGWTHGSADGLSPAMGFGRFPNRSFYQSGFFSNLKYQDNHSIWHDIPKPTRFVDSPKCYDLIYWGYVNRQLEEAFTFGGPGGNCGI